MAVYVVVSRALYDDIDNQLHSRARLLIESGSLAADPGKAIEGTAYSDVNAMLVIPGRSIYTANQQGQTLPIGEPEKDVIDGQLLLSLRTADHQRVLAVHLTNGSSLLISKSLAPTGQVLKRLGTVLLIVGGIGVAIAAFAGGMVAARVCDRWRGSPRPPNGWPAPTTCARYRCSAATNSPGSPRLST